MPGSEINSEDLIVNKIAKGREGLLVETLLTKSPAAQCESLGGQGSQSQEQLTGLGGVVSR